MPRLSWSQSARLDLVRLREFLTAQNKDAAVRAIRTIQRGVKIIAKNPKIGQRVEGLPPGIRKWVIEFGKGAYIVRYENLPRRVVVPAVRHSREVGF